MSRPPALPEPEQPGGAPLPAKLEPLVETARAYARAATSKNTNRAYAADWRDYLRWRARQGLDLKPLADPRMRRPLSRGARVRRQGRRRQGPDRRHDRAPALGARLEFRPEGPALRPQGPPCRDRARRRAPHPWPAARPEGGAAAGACRWRCSTSCPRRTYETCATGRSCCSASPAACAARKSPASS